MLSVPHLRVVAAVTAAATLTATATAQQSCTNTTFAVALRNCTISSDVTAWGHLVEVGTPRQRLCLVPSTVVNSTLLSQKSLCAISQTPALHQCEALRGGFFNENSSSTWTTVALADYNDTRSNPTWDHFNPPGITKVGYDVLNFPNANIALQGTGLALNQYGNNSNAGMLGLGIDSVFLQDAVRQGVAGSRSWSLDAGSQSLANPRNGELVVGGYNAGRTDGSFYWTAVSNMAGDRPCPLRTRMVDVSVTLANGSVVPVNSRAETVEACIEPYDNLFRFTAGMLLRWKEITGFNDSQLGVYSNQGAAEGLNLSFTEYGLPYAMDKVGDWSLSITLDNGYTTTMPASELVRPLLGWDRQGNRVPVPGMANLQILNNPTDVGEVPTLGKIFLSRSYLAVNYETGLFGLAAAAVPTQPDKYMALSCKDVNNGTTGSGSSGSGSNSTNMGAVIGGAVGGGVAVILLIVLAILLWRRKRRARRAEVAHGTLHPLQQDIDLGYRPPTPVVEADVQKRVFEVDSQTPASGSPFFKYKTQNSNPSPLSAGGSFFGDTRDVSPYINEGQRSPGSRPLHAMSQSASYETAHEVPG